MAKLLNLFTALLLIVAGLEANAQNTGEGAWTLQMCIDHAMKNNVTVIQSDLQTQIQENNLTQSRFSRLPSLNGTGNLNYNIGRTIDPFTNTFENQTIQSNSYSLSTGITLFAGNRINSTIAMNDASYEASIKAQEALKNQIKLSVVTAYLQIIQAEETRKNAESQSELTGKQLERVRKLFEAGAVDQGAVFSLEAQLANDKVQIVISANQLQLAYTNLKNLLQLDDESFRVAPVNIENLPPLPPESVADIYNQALSTMPEVQQGQLQATQAMYNEKVAKSALYPTLSAYGNINTVYSESGYQRIQQGYETVVIGVVESNMEPVITAVPIVDFVQQPFTSQIKDNLGQTVGISLSVPIFNGMRNSTNLQNARLNSQITELQLEGIKNTLRTEITTAYTNMIAAKSRYDAALSSEEAQKKNYEFSEKRFEAGLLNSVELLNAKNMWFQAQIQLLNAKYEYLFRNLLIRFYKGEEIAIAN